MSARRRASARRASGRNRMVRGESVRRALGSVLGPAILAAALTASSAPAESLWGMEGIGLPVTPYDHAARGAGSTGIAAGDPFGMSFANPAAIAHARLVQAHFGLLVQDRWVRAAGGETDRRLNTRITMGRVVLPGPGPLRWSVGYHDLTDGSYQVALRANSGREDAYLRTWKGEGGLGELSTGVAASALRGRAAVGLSLGFANGTIREVVTDEFTSSLYTDRRDILRTRILNGRVLGLGAQVVPWRGLGLGGTWRSSAEVGLHAMSSSSEDVDWDERAEFDLPSEVGLGVTLGRSRIRVAADWNHAAWGGTKFRPTAGPGSLASPSFRDTDRLGVGVTLLPVTAEAKGTLRQRTVWRAGFSWGQLPVRQRAADAGAPGAEVSEWTVTAGCGLPVQVDRGWLDLFLEAGRTGNLEEVRLRETFIRLGAGVTFGRFEKSF